MRIEFDIETNPGPFVLFMAEIKIESSADINSGWWGLWIGWWLYRACYWRDMLWRFHWDRDEGWDCWQLRVVGFEINWQCRRRI